MSVNTVYSSTTKKQIFNLTGPDIKDSLLLRIHHTTENCKKEQILRFLHATFNKLENTLAVANIRGNIYLVNLTNNKYWLLQSFTSCTILKFSSEIDEELLVGLNGGKIGIINIENARIKTVLHEHRDSVIGISFNSKNHCLSFSRVDAILWDLKEYVKIHTVCCKCDTAIKEIVFVPTSNFIVGYDQDDIISIWDSNNYDVIKQIVPASWDNYNLRSVAFTRDGRTMVLAGTAPQIAVYFLHLWSIVKILKLTEECKASKKVDFIQQPFDAGANQLLAVLGTNGTVYIYNMDKDELVGQVISEGQTWRMELSNNGRFLTTILATGQLLVYSVVTFIGKIKRKESINLMEKNEHSGGILLKKPSYDSLKVKNELEKLMETDKLKLFLKEFMEYPNIYRHKIWSNLLKLPHNSQQYNTFVLGKRMHESVLSLNKAYPLNDQMTLKIMRNLISDLILWCPFFYSVDYLPLFVFPFIDVFKNDPVARFEAVVTVLLNWCQFWFQYHPLPPLNILTVIENIFLESDGMLLSHLARYDVNSMLYAWALLESTFSEVLLSKDWLLLWDHILTNEPSFLILAPVAYCLCQKNALLSLNCRKHFQQFFHQHNPIDMKHFIQKIHDLLDSTSNSNHPRQYLSELRPIGSEFYPKFDQFPSMFNQNPIDLHGPA